MPQAPYRLGNKIQNVVPTLCTDRISVVPLSNSHKRLTMDKPMPSPRSQWFAILGCDVAIECEAFGRLLWLGGHAESESGAGIFDA